jgi:hypothetical protein
MKQLPKRSGEFLFEIVMRRYETRPTMMTSNRPLFDGPIQNQPLPTKRPPGQEKRKRIQNQPKRPPGPAPKRTK